MLIEISLKIRKVLPLWLITLKERWICGECCQFGKDQRSFIFISIARFLHLNRPVPGYYFEFGCNEANTIRKAWDHFQYPFDLTYIGFIALKGSQKLRKLIGSRSGQRGNLLSGRSISSNSCAVMVFQQASLRQFRVSTTLL